MRHAWIAAMVTAFVLVAGLAAYSADSAGSATVISAASARSGGSSTLSSSTTRPSIVQLSSAVQYPLRWGTSPPVTCEGTGGFCLTDIYLGFAGQSTTNTYSATTMIQGTWTTVVNSSTTTVTNAITISPPVNNTGTYIVDVYAYVQDAATGQNATGPDGEGPVLGNSCNLQPTGLTDCGVDAPYMPSVPSGGHYRVTLFVTAQYEPCSLRPGGPPCASKLLAPPIAFTISE